MAFFCVQFFLHFLFTTQPTKILIIQTKLTDGTSCIFLIICMAQLDYLSKLSESTSEGIACIIPPNGYYQPEILSFGSITSRWSNVRIIYSDTFITLLDLIIANLISSGHVKPVRSHCNQPKVEYFKDI